MDNNYPPYIFLDEQGNTQGILVDQWALWEKRTGVKVELLAIPWEDALDGMENGDFDVIDTIFYTVERAEIYDFTDAYARIDVPIFFHNDISGIADVDDLEGFCVAVKSGDADARFLEKANIKDLVYYASYEEIIQAAARGEENIFVIDQPPGLYFLYKYGLHDQFNYSAPLFSGNFHRAVKKGNLELLTLVEEGFAAISKSEYQLIDNRWLGIQQNNRWWKYLPYLQAGAIITFLIICVLTIFNRTLQKRGGQRTRELKQALDDLQKSERKYREIFNATNEAIFIHAAPGGKLLHVNETMLQMYGFETEEEAISKSAADLRLNDPPYSEFDAQEKLRKAWEEGPQVFEWPARKKSGETFWTEVSLRSSKISGEGQILAVVRDVTKRKQAEQALQDSHDRLLMILDSIDADIYVADLNTYEILFVNQHMRKNFGGNLIGQACWQVFRGGSQRCPNCTNTSLVDTDGNPTGVSVWEGQNPITGQWYTNYDRAIRWIDGRLVHLQIATDITKRKLAEESLRESESILKEAQVTAELGSYVLDFASGMWKSSAVLDKIFGIDDSYVRSVEGWGNLIHPDDRRQMVDYFTNEVADKHTRFDREYRIIRQTDKAERWVHGLGAIETDSQDRVVKMYGVIQDITARKQVEVEMRQRVMELEMLHESGLAINQLLEPKEIGQKVIELLRQKLEWHHTTIRLYHPQDESLELLAFNQPGTRNEAERREVVERFSRLIAHVDHGVSGWAVRHKQVVRLNDLPNDPRYVDTYPGLQSGLYVPMKLDDRVVGVISIESEKPDAFSAADEQLVTTLANQAASALENARLFEAEQKQRKVSEALRDALSAGASMSASLDFKTILDRLLEALERVVPFEGGSIMLVQQEKHTTSIAKMRGYKGLDRKAVEKVISQTFDITTVENLRWMTRHKQPLVIPDVEKYPGWIRLEATSFICSWAGAPIIVNDEIIAFFSLDGSEPNFFTDEHVELLRAFTGQASLALQNARLFEQSQHRYQEFAALYETSGILSAEINLPDLLQIIVTHAKKLLNASSSGIYLYRPESGEVELIVDTASYLTVGTRLRLGEGAAGHVAQTRHPLRLDDYSTWESRSRQYDGIPLRAVVEVPMLYGGELIGVLSADEFGDIERKFSEADERLLSLFASQAAGAIHSARLRAETTHRLDQLQALHTIDRAISSSFDLRPILNTVITQTIAQLNVDAVDVLLYHPHLQRLEFFAGQGFRTRSIEQTRLRLRECLSGRAAFERRMIHVPNLNEKGLDFTRADMLKAEEFLEFYAVPLIAKGEVKGVLEVFHRTALDSNPEWLDFLETLAKQAAITIDQTQLFDNLQRVNLELVIAYDATIEGWARAMDLRDKETESHTERVTDLTISLAKAMGVKESEILNTRRGALLHDIGKMGVPDNILLKEGKLTEEEWRVMRRHPQFAYEMLYPIKYLRQSLDIPYCHHEKWDGTGYPRGLKGEQIPLAARIFSIADVWDALTSDRPYRKAWTNEEALVHIREQSGKQFDPKVVEAFLKLTGSE
jgi:PAS domain S-box-containing protein